MCEKIRDKWKPESMVYVGKVLDQFENDYVKYHTFLALGLHNSVQYKDADYRKLKFIYLSKQFNKFNCFDGVFLTIVIH
jgi:hypothetical protein